MAKLLTLVNVADVNLYHGTTKGTDAVLQGNGRVGVGAGVEHNAVDSTVAYLLHLVDEAAFDVALIIKQLHLARILLLKLLKIRVKPCRAVDTRLTNTQHVEVRTIDYLYFHIKAFLQN